MIKKNTVAMLFSKISNLNYEIEYIPNNGPFDVGWVDYDHYCHGNMMCSHYYHDNVIASVGDSLVGEHMMDTVKKEIDAMEIDVVRIVSLGHDRAFAKRNPLQMNHL